MFHEEMGWDVNWIHVAQDRDLWQTHVTKQPTFRLQLFQIATACSNWQVQNYMS